MLEGDREQWFRDLGYTFWNREMLDALAARLRPESGLRWVELAAGTGRLAAELTRRGITVTPTDDYSQAADRAADRVRANARTVNYGEWVARLSAREAIRLLRPEAVLCAWPPLGSGLVPDLLAGRLPGSEDLHLVVAVGEPGGASELPNSPMELPEGWTLDSWPDCEEWLVGFNDPPLGPGWRTYSRLLAYRKIW